MHNTKSRVKSISIVSAVIFLTLLSLPNLFANGLSLSQNDSELNLYIPIELYQDSTLFWNPKYRNLAIHKIGATGYDRLIVDETYAEMDLTLRTFNALSFLSVEDENIIFMDIKGIEKNETATHIISPANSGVDGMNLSAIHSSKSLRSERNDTIGCLVRYEIKDLTFGAQYVTAFSLQGISGDERAQKDNSWAVSLSYQVNEPLVFDVHYENFDSDIVEIDTPMDKRYGIAATYTFSLWDKQPNCNFTSVYRKIEYDSLSGYNENQTSFDEFFIHFIIGF